jgi:hypothetical protein
MRATAKQSCLCTLVHNAGRGAAGPHQSSIAEPVVLGSRALDLLRLLVKGQGARCTPAFEAIRKFHPVEFVTLEGRAWGLVFHRLSLVVGFATRSAHAARSCRRLVPSIEAGPYLPPRRRETGTLTGRGSSGNCHQLAAIRRDIDVEPRPVQYCFGSGAVRL